MIRSLSLGPIWLTVWWGALDSPEAVSQIYPRLDQAAAWRQSMQFVDPNHSTGQSLVKCNVRTVPGVEPQAEEKVGH